MSTDTDVGHGGQKSWNLAAENIQFFLVAEGKDLATSFDAKFIETSAGAINPHIANCNCITTIIITSLHHYNCIMDNDVEPSRAEAQRGRVAGGCSQADPSPPGFYHSPQIITWHVSFSPEIILA